MVLVVWGCLMCNITMCYAYELCQGAEVSACYDYSIQAREEIWRYRIYKGKKQKRLWSCTDNKWITDHWITVK